MVVWIENSLDLMEESPLYSIVPTSLVNPDIVLPHKLFLERRGLPEIPPGLISEGSTRWKERGPNRLGLVPAHAHLSPG